MGKLVDYVPACLPEKKAPELVWDILFGLNDNSIYGHHNARIKKWHRFVFHWHFL